MSNKLIQISLNNRICFDLQFSFFYQLTTNQTIKLRSMTFFLSAQKIFYFMKKKIDSMCNHFHQINLTFVFLRCSSLTGKVHVHNFKMQTSQMSLTCRQCKSINKFCLVDAMCVSSLDQYHVEFLVMVSLVIYSFFPLSFASRHKDSIYHDCVHFLPDTKFLSYIRPGILMRTVNLFGSF